MFISESAAIRPSVPGPWPMSTALTCPSPVSLGNTSGFNNQPSASALQWLLCYCCCCFKTNYPPVFFFFLNYFKSEYKKNFVGSEEMAQRTEYIHAKIPNLSPGTHSVPHLFPRTTWVCGFQETKRKGKKNVCGHCKPDLLCVSMNTGVGVHSSPNLSGGLHLIGLQSC